MLNLGADCPICYAPGNRYAAFVRWPVGHGAQPHGRRPDGWALVCVRESTPHTTQGTGLMAMAIGSGQNVWKRDSLRRRVGPQPANGHQTARRCRSLLMTRTDLLALLEGIDFVVKKRRKRYKKAA